MFNGAKVSIVTHLICSAMINNSAIAAQGKNNLVSCIVLWKYFYILVQRVIIWLSKLHIY